MENNLEMCTICTGQKSDLDVFRLINYYEKTVCEVCLQTVVAPASPKLFINYVLLSLRYLASNQLLF